MTREDVNRYIEYEAAGIGVIENDVAAVVCMADDCDNRVRVDPATNVPENGIEVKSEEFDMAFGEPTGKTIVHIFCSKDCRARKYQVTPDELEEARD